MPDSQFSVHSAASEEKNDFTSRKLSIVVAEDNPADALLIREALAEHWIAADVTVLWDGEQVLRAIERMDTGDMACPDLLILDLNLPRYDGRYILARMRQSRRCGTIPVIIVTSSNATDDREVSARLGATRYFVKPIALEDFLRFGEVVGSVLSEGRTKYKTETSGGANIEETRLG